MTEENDSTAKTVQHDGHTYELHELNDDGTKVSVICLDPEMRDEIDYTEWPSDDVISGWVGRRVRFSDGGDSNRGVESIFDAAPLTLEGLLEHLNAVDDDADAIFPDRTSLPSFGGEEPADTMGVWSWDETRLIVSPGDGGDAFQIVARDEWDAA